MPHAFRLAASLSAITCLTAATTQAVRPTLGDPSAVTLTFGRLFNASHLEALRPVSAVTCSALENAAQAPPITATELDRLMLAATPLRPSDSSIDAWQYAPAYAITFSADGRHWAIHLYLGGRGTVEDDAGHKALFSVPWQHFGQP